MLASIIIPCLNEEKTIGTCIERAQAGIAELGLLCEILVIDNGSTDKTKDIALQHGARVIPAKARGYGNAVRAGLSAAQGEYVLIGDGDDSYDFSTLPLFIRTLQEENCDLVIGNRFTGHIEDNAMPFLNRYFGNPLLTGIGRLLFGNICGDFHSGLRAGKRHSLLSLDLTSQKMEMATEMIIRAALHGLVIREIPITLSKDGRGRPPHLRRWRDGFTNLFFMFKVRFFEHREESSTSF